MEASWEPALDSGCSDLLSVTARKANADGTESVVLRIETWTSRDTKVGGHELDHCHCHTWQALQSSIGQQQKCCSTRAGLGGHLQDARCVSGFVLTARCPDHPSCRAPARPLHVLTCAVSSLVEHAILHTQLHVCLCVYGHM